MLNRLFETFRGFKILVIICLPLFGSLDNHLFDNRIPRILLNLRDRGKSYGNYRGYSLSQMNWIRYWFDKLPKGIKHKCYTKAEPNFYGHFLDLEPERSKALDKLSTTGKEKLLKAQEIKMDGLLGYSEVANKVSRSVIWVRTAVSKLKIRHKRIIKCKKYFDEGVVDQLISYLDTLEK